MNIQTLNTQIIACTKCPRLVSYRNMVAKEKVKRHMQEEYWGKPVPGFGDSDPKILIVGLAPAAHGANRTGRMFTGDSSGDWLYRALFETGFANQPYSSHKDDGLLLNQVYITASLRCAPPQNKPLPDEILNCRGYIETEFSIFKNLKVIVALGQIAFKNVCQILHIKGLKFAHNHLYSLETSHYLLSSYHPSRQNTQTNLLLWDEWIKVFMRAREIIGTP